ncbi:unnamed protein product [Candida verbasci]|uniref:Uncharacterized protein n=1 Tax=Candida verbasci TaxID=1227364 RepID=A0A9W4TY41_9ASCO|nr:unnamed protein product [Candida verbasci]
MKILILLLQIIGLSIALSNNQLKSLVQSKSSKLISLTDENFESILQGKRDYHIIALLTSSSPQINCVLCKEIGPELEIIANSWFKDHPNGIEDDFDLYFFKSEFLESRKLFGLFQLNNIPKIFYFPPTNSTANRNYVSEKVEYQFYQGDHKDLMIRWFSELTGYKFNLYIPVDKTKLAIHAILGFTSVFLLKRYKKYVFNVLKSKNTWGTLSLILILLFTTGYMFNQIRGSPYIIEHQDGRREFFLPGQQTQLGIETQIISFVYGILSILLIVLIKRAPTIKTDSINLLLVSIISGLIFVMFSTLLALFGLKGLGFPYRFIRFIKF